MTLPPDTAALVERIKMEASRLHLRSTETRPLMTAAAATIEAQARRIEELSAALVAHNCGTPGCLCYECCRAEGLARANGARDEGEGADVPAK